MESAFVLVELLITEKLIAYNVIALGLHIIKILFDSS